MDWDFGDGTGSAQLNPSHTYIDTGYFHVSLILTSVDGYEDTVSKNNYIHIKWNPIPLITSTGDSGCEPYYVSLITNYYSGAIYSWNLGNGVIKNSSAVYYTYPDSGVYPVLLNVTYNNGCAQSQTAGPIVVFPRPSFTYSLAKWNRLYAFAVQFTISNNEWSIHMELGFWRWPDFKSI
ncbi:MAG: hypothetical protein IPO63_14835 [Bacteroidetes bacterium]|nr:hypothetical protein [Bacteroidota bacterium]